jgi:hypothetical protein
VPADQEPAAPAHEDPQQGRELDEGEQRTLAPYIPAVDLRHAVLHVGRVPWYLGEGFAGITLGNHIYLRPDQYRPDTPAGMALLGHELVHVRQYRHGMTRMSYLWACRRGYVANPFELEARAVEQRIRRDLAARGFRGWHRSG